MAYYPRHQTQLGRGPTDGRTDCGPRSWQMAVDWSTRGARVPTIRELRDEAGVDLDDRTSISDGDRAMETYRVPFAEKWQQPWDTVVTALRNGKPVVVCVRYSLINRMQPGKSGDRNFGGGHSIYLQGTRLRGDGKRIITSFDSLYDGRRNEIPKGPQDVLSSTLRAAAGAFAGAEGKAYFGIVSTHPNSGRARRLVGGYVDDDSEQVIESVAEERNRLLSVAAATDEVFRFIIDNPQLPPEIHLEAEARLAIIREAINDQGGADDPYLDPIAGCVLPDTEAGEGDDDGDDEEYAQAALAADEKE